MGSRKSSAVPSPGTLVAFLSILALLFAGAGGVLSCLYLYDVGHEEGLTMDEAKHGGKIFLAGSAAGCVFWALAYLVRVAYSTAVAMRASNRSFGRASRASLAAVPGGQSSAMSDLLGPAEAATAPPVDLGEFEAEPVFDFELAEGPNGKADEGHDERKRKREKLTDELAAQVAATIEAGELDEAEALLNHLSGQVGEDDSHCVDLRRRMQRQRDQQEFGSGDDAPVVVAPIEAESESPHDADGSLDIHAARAEEEAAEQLDEGSPPRVYSDSDIEDVKQRVADLMSVAKFEQAEAEARALADARPGDEEIDTLLQRVLREAEAYHKDMRHRLKKQIQQHCDNRRWGGALEAAKMLADSYPESSEGRKVARQLKILQANARIEEVRRLRDRIRDMLQRRRYTEAIRVAEEVMDRFPDTQAAAELRKQIGRMRRLARKASDD